MKYTLLIILGILIIGISSSRAQSYSVSGRVLSEGKPVEFAVVGISGSKYSTFTDSSGYYFISKIPAGNYKLMVSSLGYFAESKNIIIGSNLKSTFNFDLRKQNNELKEVVVTGTMKEINRLESPVSVEVYSASFFKKNPAPDIFDALQQVNGVRPQINCNVCSTGDIHINGLEGPYTMVLIDGMPIVSSLSTVYGLSGIPNSLVERIEIVKGPASSLYGSEAVGGLINIITKKPENAQRFSLDFSSTSWQEINIDLASKINIGKNIMVLTGINAFHYDKIMDVNNDHFTDATLRKKISVFQKWQFNRENNLPLSLAVRYFTEERWGGDTRWNKEFRGTDSIYGENILTNRLEVMGNYALPVKELINLSFSFNSHFQDSWYGVVPYFADQHVGFIQLNWDKKINNHDFLIGTASRLTYYDDNTTATHDFINNISKPDIIFLPGIFLQDEMVFNVKHKILLGFRYDYNSVHGNIYTPRLAYKYTLNQNNIFRLNAGTGFRVVNIFTEDHASLTGARTVEVRNKLSPEESYNINLNYIKKIYTTKTYFVGLDISSWYTHFTNRIAADYLTDPDKIIYDNLNGYAVSKGISANIDVAFDNGLKLIAGGTLMDITTVQNGNKERPLLTEKYTSTWSVSYKINSLDLNIDYTGNVYGSMKLPVLGALDPRSPVSPVWSIQNIQFNYSGIKNMEIYAGIKNILDFTPTKGNPFLIARSNDPFDKNVSYDNNGQVLSTFANPYALTFDPTYVYAPNQGRRLYFGIRYSFN